MRSSSKRGTMLVLRGDRKHFRALTRVSKQARAESLRLFYSSNSFKVSLAHSLANEHSGPRGESDVPEASDQVYQELHRYWKCDTRLPGGVRQLFQVGQGLLTRVLICARPRRIFTRPFDRSFRKLELAHLASGSLLVCFGRTVTWMSIPELTAATRVKSVSWATWEVWTNRCGRHICRG